MRKTSWASPAATTRRSWPPRTASPSGNRPGPAGRTSRERSTLAVFGETPVVDHAWFRGGWWDALTTLWKDIERGAPLARPPLDSGRPSPGASLYVPLAVAPGETRRVRLLAAWHVPASRLLWGESVCCCCGDAAELETFRPWYAGRFPDIAALSAHWRENFEAIRSQTLALHRLLLR